MRVISVSLTMIMLTMFSFTANATAPVDCNADSLNRQIDSLYNEFLGARSEVDLQDSIEAASEFTAQVEQLLDLCGLSLGEDSNINSEQTGLGTEDEPYVVRAAGVADFVSIRVTDDIRPADDILIEESVFPANVPEDMEFFITFLEFNCGTSASDACFMDEDAFRLIGDMGIIYEPAKLRYSAYLPESRKINGGGQRTGAIPFMVNVEDKNFRLVYYPNADAKTGASGEVFYFHAQGTQDTMEVFSKNPELLVRKGPGSDYTAIGAFRRGQTGIATGRSTDGQWIFVNTPEVSGWVSADYVRSDDDIGNLTVLEFDD
jgi:hypothetical protein